jgi:DNA-binding transcriptional ArsR family regulator
MEEVLELTDPRAMRALAHPVRLGILELLHAEETATASECSRAVGESPQACSYHLRALAKWGLVKQVSSDDARETRWAPAARTVQFSSLADESPEFQAAAGLLRRRVFERDDRLVAAYIAREHELEPEWRDATTFESGVMYVTLEELQEIERQVHELVKKHARRTRADRPDGARRVDIVFRAIPKVGD